MGQALRIAALVKRYQRHEVLARVDLGIAAGEAFGLVGANGAGNNTQIKCVLDINACDARAIEILGIAARHPPARRRLAYQPDRVKPPKYQRGREFLARMREQAGARY
jgi:ABC-type multidrug transport system ATPase subunit